MKTFILGVFFIFMSFISVAQSMDTKLSPEQQEELKAALTEYFEALNLSEEQKPEFTSITKKYAGKMKNVKDSDVGKFKKMKQLKGIRDDKNEEMQALLSEEQYDIYLDKQEEMQEKMKAKRKQQ